MRGRRRTLLAAAVAAPWVLFAVARLLAADRWIDAFVPLVSFTPWVALTAPLPVVAALVLRRRLAALAALAAGVALLVVIVPRWSGAEARPGPGRPLTVLAANLLFGQADPRRVAQLARTADVVVLVELPAERLARFDAAGLRARFPHRVLDLGPVRGGNGSAVLSRFPLTRIAVPATATAQPAAMVRVPGSGGVRVQAVHPPPPVDGERIAQWRESLDTLLRPAPDGTPTVLAGDFNATLDHHALREVLDRGFTDAADAVGAGLRWTWPSDRRPTLTIDHVLVDESLPVGGFAVHDVAGSDHRAVVAELELP